jgi:formylglycine-generating enzyme required for sulfatase activity
MVSLPTFASETHLTGHAEQVVIRVPGMTESFTLVLCPEATIVQEDGSVSIPSLYVLSTEVVWDLYDIYVYKLDESEEDSDADAISRPSKPYVPPDRGFGHDGYPAIGMTRQAAEGFCSWLAIKTGLSIRLPTQTEWTYLALAGESGDFCCGVDLTSLDQIAWFAENADRSTHPVGEKAPNLFGLYDMHGNAAEWVMSDTRKPIAYGGGFLDSADESTAVSFQKQTSSWNQSDPQIPKSQWWLADCSWVGFRFVVEAESVDPEILKGLLNAPQKPN